MMLVLLALKTYNIPSQKLASGRRSLKHFRIHVRSFITIDFARIYAASSPQVSYASEPGCEETLYSQQTLLGRHSGLA